MCGGKRKSSGNSATLLFVCSYTLHPFFLGSNKPSMAPVSRASLHFVQQKSCLRALDYAMMHFCATKRLITRTRPPYVALCTIISGSIGCHGWLCCTLCNHFAKKGYSRGDLGEMIVLCAMRVRHVPRISLLCCRKCNVD
jgi:hypothetical protein